MRLWVDKLPRRLASFFHRLINRPRLKDKQANVHLPKKQNCERKLSDGLRMSLGGNEVMTE